MFDTIIRGGKVIDGTGAPWFYADVGIVDGKVVAVARDLPGEAKKAIDAKGKFVCPGFIDIHSHADTAILRSPGRVPKVTQGVTLEVFSNCGLGGAPVNEKGRTALLDYVPEDYEGLDFSWLRVSEYLDTIPKPGVNVAYLIPHGAVRTSAMGYDMRPATKSEIDVMRGLVKEGMEDGAFGLSTGLAYVPMSSSAPDEIVSLSEIVGKHGGFVASHLRNYRASNIVGSIGEMVEAARVGGAPVQISHYAASGGRGKLFEGYISDARDRGYDLTFDSYPYHFAAGFTRNTIPAKYHNDGVEGLVRSLKDPGLRDTLRREVGVLTTYDLTKLVITNVGKPELLHLVGKKLTESAEAAGKDVLDFLCDILAEDPSIGHANFSGSLEDMKVLAKSPLHMVASDSIDVVPGRGKTHPRLYGTFTRFLRMYVKETPLLTWEEAIWKMTGFPAWRLGLSNRGVVRKGASADLVVLDPAEVSDRATLESPDLTSVGIEWVIVNGVIEVADGEITGDMGGKVLRKGDA